MIEIKRADKDLLEEVFRKHIADLESEKYRAEMENCKHFPFYDKKITKVKELYEKLTDVIYTYNKIQEAL